MQKHFHIIIAVTAAIAGILFGFDTGVISGAIVFINKQFHLTPQMNGFFVGSVLLGATIGAIISGRAADKFGRKIMLIVDAIIFIIGTIITISSLNIFILILGRLIVGIGIGIASYTAPLYIAETAPAKSRGALVSINQIFIGTGIFISYLVDYYFSKNGNWRMMFASGIVPAAGLLFGMILLPYSPRWKISKGQDREGLAILKRLRQSQDIAQAEFSQIKQMVSNKRSRWRDLFSKHIRKTVTIGVGLSIVQQVIGINTIVYYAPTILKMSSLMNTSNAIFSSIGIGVLFIISTLVTMFIVDKVGRKPIMYYSLVVMAITLVIMSMGLAPHTQVSKIERYSVLFSMFAYIAAFGVSAGPIVWLIISEIFPLSVRGLGTSVATAANWLSNWAITVSFLSLVEYYGIRNTFLGYALMCIVSLVFIYFVVPETSGCTLETLEANLMAGKKSRDLGSVVDLN